MLAYQLKAGSLFAIVFDELSGGAGSPQSIAVVASPLVSLMKGSSTVDGKEGCKRSVRQGPFRGAEGSGSV